MISLLNISKIKKFTLFKDEVRRQLITSEACIVFVVPQNADVVRRASKKMSFIKVITSLLNQL